MSKMKQVQSCKQLFAALVSATSKEHCFAFHISHYLSTCRCAHCLVVVIKRQGSCTLHKTLSLDVACCVCCLQGTASPSRRLLALVSSLVSDRYVFLQYLKTISDCLRPVGRRAAFYLAAAVSDFFLPWKQMVRDSMRHVVLLMQLTALA